MSAPRRFFRPTWVEVSLQCIQNNLRAFKERMPAKTLLMFVVKANAYGHGAVVCAKTAEKNAAADWLGVSSVEEGVALREAGVRLPILILGSLYPFESVLAAAEFRLTPIVASLESAQRLVAAAAHLGRRLDCHLKIDTGMGRIGVTSDAGLRIVDYLASHRGVRLQGVYTHLACAESDPQFTRTQLKAFRAFTLHAARSGVHIALRHAANSAGALRYAASRFDMVRPGLAIYGLCDGFEPALTLKSRIVFMKKVPAGTSISYGANWHARRTTRIATIPIGYADGYFRRLSNKGKVIIDGKSCPVVGNVTMDQLMVDVSAAPTARVGSEVVLFGGRPGQGATVDEIARTLGTIPYEVVTALSARVPRVYLS